MSNAIKASPEAYPKLFLAAINNGSAVMAAEDLPWTVISSAKHFRLCLKLIRATRGHPLRPMALPRWRVEITPSALIVSQYNVSKGIHASMNSAIIESALST